MSSTLPRTADVVVVGGGVMGAAIAYHLARRGVPEVVLLERDAIASGPTGRSTAIVRQHYSQPLLVRMAVHGLRVYGDFERELGSSSGFVRSGVLWAAARPDRAALEANVALARAEGADIDIVDPHELPDIDGRISGEGLSALAYEPTAGYCDPYLATTGFVRSAVQLGAKAAEGVSVSAVEAGSVVTSEGRIDAETVVVAAGVWSRALLEPLGFSLPVVAARAEVGRFRLPPEFGPPPPAFAEFSPRQVYFRSGGGGYLEVGTLDPSHAAEPIDPDACPEGAERETLAAYRHALAARVPAAAGGHWRGSWSAVYDVTPDWQPAIGRVPGASNVLVAAGFSGHGFKLAPAVGLSVAEAVADGAWSTFELALFDPGRFARNELVGSRYGYSVVG